MRKRWFPRTLATWKEPKGFSRQRIAEEIRAFPWRGWFLFLGLFSVALMLPNWIFGDGFRLPSPGEAVESLVHIVIMAALPYLGLRLSRRVWIRENGIAIGASNMSLWRFEELFRVVPVIREIDGRRDTLLRLEDIHGKSIEIAVDDTISLARIEEILRAQGVRFGDQ